MLYVCVVFLQTASDGPVIAVGAVGTDLIDCVFAPLIPHAFVAVTDIDPDKKVGLKSTVTVLVPCPLAMLALAGGFQVLVTPLTNGTLYVFVVPAHTSDTGPLMLTGVDGIDLIVCVRAPLLPQKFVATTEIVPDEKLML